MNLPLNQARRELVGFVMVGFVMVVSAILAVRINLPCRYVLSLRLRSVNGPRCMGRLTLSDKPTAPFGHGSVSEPASLICSAVGSRRAAFQVLSVRTGRVSGPYAALASHRALRQRYRKLTLT